jgi:hypothetical protein
VKRSGREEAMWVAIHKCIETMLGMSLHSYLYFKLAKTLVFLIISYVFSSTRSENKRAEQVLPGSWRSGGVGGGGTMYTYISKYKNNKIK